MGVVNERTVTAALRAAILHRYDPDWRERIADTLIKQGIFTENLRSDSQRRDVWRDYQQILTELGLAFPRGMYDRIELTSIGLALLDGSYTFEEAITIQALRYQYPNGHNQLSHALRRTLPMPLQSALSLAEVQRAAGVRIRPAVLLWQVLNLVEALGEDPAIDATEITRVVMRCSSHSEAFAAASVIADSRSTGILLPPPAIDEATIARMDRNAEDWMKLLSLTPIFTLVDGRPHRLALKQLERYSVSALTSIADELTKASSFWDWPQRILSRFDKESWYRWFGSIDLGLPATAIGSKDLTHSTTEEFRPTDLYDFTRDAGAGSALRPLEMKQFLPADTVRDIGRLPASGSDPITIAYELARSKSAHLLHDEMIEKISAICLKKGAEVFHDPLSVDLLARHSGVDFIVEVKSVTSRNTIAKLRFAIGQVLQYDYQLSRQSQNPRRRVIGLTASVPKSAWYVPFLNDHLDIDLLSLEGDLVAVHTNSSQAAALFDP